MRAIRRGIALNLSTIKGCQISAYMLSSPTPPTLHVYPDPSETITYHQSSGAGMSTKQMVVQGIVSSDVGSQDLLDEWMEDTGDQSVFRAVESDPTLGGACDDLTCRTLDGYQEYVMAGEQGAFLAAMWHVEVIGTGG